MSCKHEQITEVSSTEVYEYGELIEIEYELKCDLCGKEWIEIEKVINQD